VLELSEKAGCAEINQAYHRLKKIYSADSSILSPLTRDFTKRKQTDILRRIETAHRKLTEYFAAHPRNHIIEAENVKDQDKIGSDITARLIFSGRNLRSVRTKLAVRLQDMAQKTKTEADLLKALEKEDTEALPEETELKGLLRKYSRFLGLNSGVVIRDYLGRLETKKQGKKALDRPPEY
jgi:hypothetical protein